MAHLTPERWKQIEELYHAAQEQGPDARVHADPELRSEVERLLAQDGTALDHPAWQHASTVTMAAPLAAGTEIGQYRIEASIGEGGMSVVYRALDAKLNGGWRSSSFPTS